MSKTVVSIIVAVDRNRAIGKDNKLLWHIPEDFQWFKSHTNGHPVIMGRKTHESIGKVLPNRLNVVITSQKAKICSPAISVSSLQEGIDLATQNDDQEVFIIGGSSVYEQALPLADRLYITVVDAEYEADAYFPDYSSFQKIVFQKKSHKDDLSYTFYILEK